MPKKTVEKLKVVEIKTYKCSDGSVYDTEDTALLHEQFLKDCNNNPLIASKIKELESRILALEAENATLSARIQYLESKNTFPWRQPNPDVVPYTQPFNPTAPTPKLPSEPGDVVYCSEDLTDLSKLSDEELKKKGYDVTYVGHKRVIVPHVTEFAFNKEKTNYGGGSGVYGNLDKEKTYGGNSGVYGNLDKK